MREIVVAWDKWYADFYISKDFVRVPQTREAMLVYALKRNGSQVAWMHRRQEADHVLVFIYPSLVTLKEGVKCEPSETGVRCYVTELEDGREVLGGRRSGRR